MRLRGEVKKLRRANEILEDACVFSGAPDLPVGHLRTESTRTPLRAYVSGFLTVGNERSGRRRARNQGMGPAARPGGSGDRSGEDRRGGIAGGGRAAEGQRASSLRDLRASLAPLERRRGPAALASARPRHHLRLCRGRSAEGQLRRPRRGGRPGALGPPRLAADPRLRGAGGLACGQLLEERRRRADADLLEDGRADLSARRGREGRRA